MLFCCISAFPLDVAWQGRPSVVPPAPSVGQTVVITASFHVADGPVRNLRVTGGVDGSIIFDRSWGNIENNLNRTVSFQWVAVAGSHTIFLQIDPDRSLAGQVASNDRLEIPVNVSTGGPGPSPTLDVVWLPGSSANPPSPTAGQVVTISANLRVNNGPANGLRVIGGVDGANIYDHNWGTVEDNGNRNVNFQWTATAGMHTVFLQIDPAHSLAGQESGNDRIEIPLNVGGSGTPPQPELIAYDNVYQNTAEFMFPDPCRQFRDADTDLIITDVVFRHISLSPNPSIYEYRFKIKNLGQRCLTSLSWKMVEQAGQPCPNCPSGRYDASRGEYVLKGREEKLVVGRVNIAQVPTSGYYKAHWTGTSHQAACVRFIVDPNNEIPELNEGNNEVFEITSSNLFHLPCWLLDWQEGD